MVKNILKVDPVAFRYEDPDFIKGPGVFGEDNDFEWSEDDLEGDDFDSTQRDDFFPDFDSESFWGDDSLTEEEF